MTNLHRWFKRYVRAHRWHRHHHDRAPVAAFLGITSITIEESSVSKVTLTATVPTTRKSGASLALTDIDHIALFRNGTQIDQAVPSGATVQFVDSSPLTGNDDYTVETFTKDGFVSDPSNDAIVTIAGADPAAAVTDLTATVS